MELDNKPLAVGDSVYDLAFGLGIVQSITLGFQVRFPGGFEQAYNETGIGQFPNKTLYTARPEIPIPFSDPMKNVQFERTVRAIHESFRN